MAKPTALGLVRAALTDAYVVTVRKGAGGLLVDPVIDSPAPLYPGRYVMLPVEDAELVLKRLVAVEGSMLLAKAMKRSGRKSSRRLK